VAAWDDVLPWIFCIEQIVEDGDERLGINFCDHRNRFVLAEHDGDGVCLVHVGGCMGTCGRNRNSNRIHSARCCDDGCAPIDESQFLNDAMQTTMQIPLTHRSVLALFAHPDDIEFVAAGTLLLLQDLGWQIHYCNIADGCCGSTTTNRLETAQIRLKESRRSANLLGATFYQPICHDLDVFYNAANLAKIASIVRQSQPSILLTHAPSDYMEDHMQACRLAVTAAFARSIPNFATDPPAASFEGELAIYHAQPHGNRTPLGDLVYPQIYVATDSVIERKRQLLECHQSQQQWLQSTQKLNSYLQTMLDLGREVAELSGHECEFAEGWRRHLHFGFGGPNFDPLSEALGHLTFKP